MIFKLYDVDSKGEIVELKNGQYYRKDEVDKKLLEIKNKIKHLKELQLKKENLIYKISNHINKLEERIKKYKRIYFK